MAFPSLTATAGNAIDTRAWTRQTSGSIIGILAAEVSLADANVKLQYGLVHLKPIQQNMRTPRFQNTLQIVSNHRPQR